MEEKKKKQKAKGRRTKKEQKRRKRKRSGKKGDFFEISGKGGPVKRKKITHLNVWFRLNGLGSSQNGQNSLIYNWCIGGCWFTQALELLTKNIWKDLT